MPISKISDAFTGEEFQPRTENHYEKNDGVPVAPQVDTPRPTVRQRIENLLHRGVDPLAAYMRNPELEGSEGIDMEIPDDPEAPLTMSEQNYIDVISADLAEQAPLPDEGLPRPPQEPARASPSPAAPSGGVGAEPPREAAPAAGPTPPVPTR